MPASVAGIHLGLDTHANRPAANTVPDGSEYSCSTHKLVYKSNYAGNSWATYMDISAVGFADPMTTRGDIIIRNAANATARLGIGSAGKVLTSDGTDISWQTPSAGSLTSVSNALGANVGMNNATFVDGPSCVLAVGTWFLSGVVDLDTTNNGGIGVGVAKLWDGTTVINSGEAGDGVAASGYHRMQIKLSGIVVIAAGTPTWKISAINATFNGGNILAATATGGSGNNASRLDAIKIA